MLGNTMSLDHKAIGKRIAIHRKSFAGVGMTRAQLAERTGLTRHTIRNYENGRGMSFDSAVRIAQALGIGLDDLLTGEASDGTRGGDPDTGEVARP